MRATAPNAVCATRRVTTVHRALDAGTAADLHERVAQRLRRGAVVDQNLGDVGVAAGQAVEQVLGGDVFVVHLGGQVLRDGDGRDRFPAQLRCRVGAAGAGQPVDEALGLGPDGRGINSDRFEQRCGDAVVLRQQRHQQMGGGDLRVACGGCRLQRRRQRRLGLRGRVERVHDTSLSSIRAHT